MNIFILYKSTAKIEVDRAQHSNDPEIARRASNTINAGAIIMQSWALASGGEVISTVGTEGLLKIPVDKLDELPSILERYEQATDSRISCGIGFEPNEAITALKVAEVRGGKPAVVLFNEDIANEAHSLESSKKEDGDLGPIIPNEESLLEDDEAPENDGSVKSVKKSETNPPYASKDSPPTTNTNQSEDQHAQLKQAVAAVLKDVKENMPVIQQLQQTNPSVFNSIISLVQAFVAVAQQVFAQPIQKAESASEKANIGPSDVDAEELRTGIAHERKEHGMSEEDAQRTALDHLSENPNYYSDIKKLESKAI